MNDDLISTNHHDPGDSGDRVHELFAQLADDPAPPLGFTADGIAGIGRRGARTRRIAAVTGATAGVAAVAVAVAALPGAVASGSRTSAAASSSAPVTPTCTAGAGRVFSEAKTSDVDLNRRLVLEVCPAMRAIAPVFDPTGRDLAEGGGIPDFVGVLIPGMDAATGTGAVYGMMFGLCYHGQGSASDGKHVGCHEPSEVGMQVFFNLPGASDPEPESSEVPPADRKPGVAGGSTPWIQKSTETLKDGSKVTVSEVRYGDLVSMKARRVLPSGAALTIFASNDDGSSAAAKQGSGHDRFPFTVEQMATAASVNQAPAALNSMRP